MSEEGYELEIEHFVRTSIGEKRGHETSPWRAYTRKVEMEQQHRQQQLQRQQQQQQVEQQQQQQQQQQQRGTMLFERDHERIESQTLLTPRREVDKVAEEDVWGKIVARSFHPKGSTLLNRNTTYPQQHWAAEIFPRISSPSDRAGTSRARPRTTLPVARRRQLMSREGWATVGKDNRYAALPPGTASPPGMRLNEISHWREESSPVREQQRRKKGGAEIKREGSPSMIQH